MDDLIKRQDAIDIVTFECGEWQGIANRINEQIQRLPSAEPVTYCKDCFLADLCTWRREGAEYCSYAERKK